MVHWIPLPPFASDVHRIVYARGIFFLCIALRIEEALSDPSSLYKAGADLVVIALRRCVDIIVLRSFLLLLMQRFIVES